MSNAVHVLHAVVLCCTDITYELVTKKLREIIMSRGRRGTDKQEQVEMLSYLSTVAKGPAQRFEVLAQLVSSLFDLNPSMSAYLKTSVWKKCVINLLEMVKLLEENPHVKVSSIQKEYAAISYFLDCGILPSEVLGVGTSFN
jgi:hypothetical protein